MEKIWKIQEPDPKTVHQIRRTLKCSAITATILANRNIISSSDISAFFSESFSDIREPFCLKDMSRAVDRVVRAIQHNEKIVVFGDYDADGITATVLLYQFLKDAGALVTPYIPHRINEGYSLQPRHMTDKVFPGRVDLIITVDCGSASHEAVDLARAQGMDVIITDHHTVAGDLPGAVAVINPKRPDCASGLKDLAGVGVAFYLAIAVRKALRDLGHWDKRPEPNLKQYCDLVALGTVADVVPLKTENRIFVKQGLQVIRSGQRSGLNALINACRLDRDFIDAEDIAFRLVPRLNAAGRLSHAKIGMSLLTAGDEDSADQIARDLCHKNHTRQLMEQEMVVDIENYVRDHPGVMKQPAIVLAHANWHEGILGIVASRIADRFFKPVVLLSKKDSISRGSARSVPGFDLYGGLALCAEALEQFGGHPMAAGLSIKTDHIPMFRQMFEKVAEKVMPDGPLKQTMPVDCELAFDQMTKPFIDELARLQPFGEENPEPLFLAREARVFHSARVGKDKRHLRLRVGQVREKAVNAIYFNAPGVLDQAGTLDGMVFHLRWNHYNGKKSPQMVVRHVAAAP